VTARREGQVTMRKQEAVEARHMAVVKKVVIKRYG
jgi:hypothetical protein